MEKWISVQTKILRGRHLDEHKGHKAPLVCPQLDRERACQDGEGER